MVQKIFLEKLLEKGLSDHYASDHHGAEISVI